MSETKNEVGFFGGGAVNVSGGADIAARMAESAQNDPRGGSGDSLFLNFSGKKGVYTIGPDSRKIPEDEMWLLNIMSFEDGWMCWKQSRPAATRMANIFTGVPVPTPDPDEFGPFDTNNGEGWHQAKGMTLKSFDTDEQGYFKINSKSGVSAFAGLQREVSDRSAAGLPRWPVLQLHTETFEARGFKNDKPVFNIVGWLTDEHVVMLGKNEIDVDEALELAQKPGGEKVEEKAEKKPERRRRRSL